MLFGFAGFSESFSDVAQNIKNAAYKGVGGGLRLPFNTMGPFNTMEPVVPNEPSMVSKPHYKAK